MRAKEPCYVFTFYTTADAIAFENYCHEHGLPGRLIPIPRELSAGCGMAWKVSVAALQEPDTAASAHTKKQETDGFLLASFRQSAISFEEIATLTI